MYLELRVKNVTPLMVYKHHKQEDDIGKRIGTPKPSMISTRRLSHVFGIPGGLFILMWDARVSGEILIFCLGLKQPMEPF